MAASYTAKPVMLPQAVVPGALKVTVLALLVWPVLPVEAVASP